MNIFVMISNEVYSRHFSNTKVGRGVLNHIFLLNIAGACALSTLAHLVYDNLFICIDLRSHTQNVTTVSRSEPGVE
jgi:hypothetical protein